FWPDHYERDVIETVAEQNTPEWIRKRSEKQDDYLARQAGRPVGYAAVKQNEIGHLFVRPDAAGRGVGTALVAYCTEVLRSRGYHTAKVYASLQATGFYENQGFREAGEKSFELKPGVVLDSILMTRSLEGCPPSAAGGRRGGKSENCETRK
ncbi:MAG: GNAT family N-acetyltransferase, partial [Planctomycetota bacterium]